MDGNRNNKPIHLVCPKCRYEFEYDISYYDRKIAELGSEIASILNQLHDYKMGQLQRSRKWWHEATNALRIKQNQIVELKNFRKLANVVAKKQELEIFSQVVKEAVGEEKYIEFHRKAEAMMQYKTYDNAVQRTGVCE